NGNEAASLEGLRLAAGLKPWMDQDKRLDLLVEGRALDLFSSESEDAHQYLELFAQWHKSIYVVVDGGSESKKIPSDSKIKFNRISHDEAEVLKSSASHRLIF